MAEIVETGFQGDFDDGERRSRGQQPARFMQPAAEFPAKGADDSTEAAIGIGHIEVGEGRLLRVKDREEAEAVFHFFQFVIDQLRQEEDVVKPEFPGKGAAGSPEARMAHDHRTVPDRITAVVEQIFAVPGEIAGDLPEIAAVEHRFADRLRIVETPADEKGPPSVK